MLGPSGSGKTTTLRMIAGLRAADERADPPRRQGRQQQGAVRAGRQHRLPGLRPVPAHERRRERRLRPGHPQGAIRRAPRAGGRCAPDGPPRGLRQAPPEPALRRPAPAGRARPGARQPAPGPAPRRAPRRPRPQAPRGDADRAQGDPARRRDHVHLRDPRPGRGPDDERPDRRLQPRPDRAGRLARRGLRAAGDRVRGRLRGHLEPAQGRGRRARLRHGRHVHRPAREDPHGRARRGGRRRTRSGSTGRSARWSTWAPTRATTSPSTAGSELVVTQQNLVTSSMEALAAEGRPTRLIWKRIHSLPINS